jgi:hypothetical protein
VEQGPGLLTYAAVALLIGVVASVGAVLGADTRRQPGGHVLDTLRQWQGLLGSMLGFLSAAGVLVLGQAIQTYQAQTKADQTAHAIGYGLAIEAERLASGLATGASMGRSATFVGVDLTHECQSYTDFAARALPAETPVYTAVLGNMAEFGDENLAMFVRFYAFYDDLRRELADMRSADCVNTPEAGIRYLSSRMQGGLSFYQIIADRYGTTVPKIAAAPAAANAAPVTATPEAGTPK